MQQDTPSDKPSQAEDSPQPRRPRPSQLLFRSPRMLLGVILVYAGMGIIFLFTFKREMPFSYLLERYGAVSIGAIVGVAGFYLMVDELSRRRSLREERFVDVDARSRPSGDPQPYIRLIEKIAALEESSKATAQELIAKFQIEQAQSQSSVITGFPEYFDSIRRVLEQKAAVADEKASILLDKGSNYSRFGILIFIASIAGWQVIAQVWGFQVQHIYGIASCSLLFVFIEFLSAWYLKQYRQFVDTSTYLIKVKSMFDRYMLIYFASKEAAALSQEKSPALEPLMHLLREEIRWPETYLTKNPDLSFAKEALDTMTLFAKSVRTGSKASEKAENGKEKA